MFSCLNENIVDREVLSKVYVDLLLADELYKTEDSLQIKREEIFVKYSLSQQNYEKEFKQFDHNLEEWDDFFELANSYLDTLKSNQKKFVKKIK